MLAAIRNQQHAAVLDAVANFALTGNGVDFVDSLLQWRVSNGVLPCR